MPTEDRRIGKLLPDPVTPPDTVCFMIQIPNAVQYRAAFLGQINVLGQPLTWDHPTDGTSCLDCEEAAQLWRNAIYNATWSDECGGAPVSCEDVADCIENDEQVRASITEIAGKSSQPGTTATPGERLPDSTWAANITPTDDCDPDVFWAQCEQFVDYLVTAGNDFLETIETYSNSVEAAQFIEMAPVIGTIVDETQLDVAIEFVNWVAEVASEWYAGADTQPNRQAIACALFCASRADCELTLENAFNTINARAGGVFTPSSLDSMDELIQAALTIVTNPALPLDTWIAFVLAFTRVAGYLGVRGLDATLNIVLKIAVNDANNDWELLCEDCPPEPADCFEFSIDEQGWIGLTGGWAQYVDNVGWGQDCEQPYLQIVKTGVTEEITKIKVKFTRAWSGGTAIPDYDKFFVSVSGGTGSTSAPVQVGGGSGPLLTGQSVEINAQTGMFWKGNITIQIVAGGFSWPQCGPNPAPAQYVDQVCFNPDV